MLSVKGYDNQNVNGRGKLYMVKMILHRPPPLCLYPCLNFKNDKICFSYYFMKKNMLCNIFNVFINIGFFYFIDIVLPSSMFKYKYV